MAKFCAGIPEDAHDSRAEAATGGVWSTLHEQHHRLAVNKVFDSFQIVHRLQLLP